MLATHPAHRHRGAATTLLLDINAEADALGLEVYCEATRSGMPLYERYGFISVGTLAFDPAKYGIADLGTERQTIMVRGALGRDGVRRKVRKMEGIY
jgi:ribosomal protein S18 acetylase RimI-like enzyme